MTPQKYRELRSWWDEVARIKRMRKRLWFETCPLNAHDWPCCYALYFDGRLFYIGQTTNLRVRMAAHIHKGKLQHLDINRVTVKARLGRKYGDWASAEVRLIARLLPAMNAMGTSFRETFAL